MDAKIAALIQAGVGTFLFMQKQPLVKGVGIGMFANGVSTGAQALKLISGVNRISPLSSEEISSINGRYQGLNYLGNPQGSPELSVLNGVGNPQGSPEPSVIGDTYIS